MTNLITSQMGRIFQLSPKNAIDSFVGVGTIEAADDPEKRVCWNDGKKDYSVHSRENETRTSRSSLPGQTSLADVESNNNTQSTQPKEQSDSNQNLETGNAVTTDNPPMDATESISELELVMTWKDIGICSLFLGGCLLVMLSLFAPSLGDTNKPNIARLVVPLGFGSLYCAAVPFWALVRVLHEFAPCVLPLGSEQTASWAIWRDLWIRLLFCTAVFFPVVSIPVSITVWAHGFPVPFWGAIFGGFAYVAVAPVIARGQIVCHLHRHEYNPHPRSSIILLHVTEFQGIQPDQPRGNTGIVQKMVHKALLHVGCMLVIPIILLIVELSFITGIVLTKGNQVMSNILVLSFQILFVIFKILQRIVVRHMMTRLGICAETIDDLIISFCYYVELSQQLYVMVVSAAMQLEEGGHKNHVSLEPLALYLALEAFSLALVPILDAKKTRDMMQKALQNPAIPTWCLPFANKLRNSLAMETIGHRRLAGTNCAMNFIVRILAGIIHVCLLPLITHGPNKSAYPMFTNNSELALHTSIVFAALSSIMAAIQFAITRYFIRKVYKIDIVSLAVKFTVRNFLLCFFMTGAFLCHILITLPSQFHAITYLLSFTSSAYAYA